jgi:hypothetical protein
MQAIARRVWREPAVFIGLIVTIVLLVLAIVSGARWDYDTIIAIAAPLASSLGIRQVVSPVAQGGE